MPSAAPVPLVLAQVGPEAMVQQIVPLLLILGVFYFLLIRPQQQQARQHETFLKNLKVGAQVVTSSGIYGRVVELRDSEVTLEIAPNVRVRHERSKIAAAAGKPGKEG